MQRNVITNSARRPAPAPRQASAKGAGARSAAREHIRLLDTQLNSLWALGRNAIIGWCPRERGIDLLVLPQYMLPSLTNSGPNLLSGSHAMDPRQMNDTAARFGLKPRSLKLPFSPGDGVSRKAIDSVIRRYSVTKSDYRASILFDIVGFSLYSPLEQVALLNSLAYSINVAHSQAMANGLRIDLGRSTTGDGFYVWNRDGGMTADLNLFFLMMLILADNALARIKGGSKSAPVLRTCFHVGSHYEYYQAEGLNPSVSGYIVGDLTIELARMIGKALDGQVIIGNFSRPNTETTDAASARIDVPAPLFMARAQDRLERLRNVELSGSNINSIKVYLTGERVQGGAFSIKKYSILDKHGLRRDVFNAKVNIYRDSAETLYLGMENKDLARFDAEESQYRPGE